ncbi:MAG: hypothetical protein A2W18_11905 [Candidatus Muproteobacteria bacterium RBG_16_60_9]|uniref:Uncharacterized protein n=1 Tax=Candidatus Muproteobacteria bacterium RBG_16_60_9 TaxID=1817755 RepID=A0A1F6VCM1_9PROT|nr:MAG: hypothetical protein A2W18_11905 [Candidatus Muproteobacteria bacterium RBG_16_60_9]
MTKRDIGATLLVRPPPGRPVDRNRGSASLTLVVAASNPIPIESANANHRPRHIIANTVRRSKDRSITLIRLAVRAEMSTLASTKNLFARTYYWFPWHR